MESDRVEKENRFQKNYILQAWLCISLALLFGASLAGVQAALGPMITENKINETKEKVPELLLPADASASLTAPLIIKPRNMQIKKGDTTKVYTVYEARLSDARPAGWVTKVSGQGYADRIELLLGLSPEADRITGLFILDQKETPGLGNKIVEPQWRHQFIDKSTRQLLSVVKTGASAPHEIDAITGATISSKAVVSIINSTVKDLEQPLAAALEDNEDKKE